MRLHDTPLGVSEGRLVDEDEVTVDRGQLDRFSQKSLGDFDSLAFKPQDRCRSALTVISLLLSTACVIVVRRSRLKSARSVRIYPLSVRIRTLLRKEGRRDTSNDGQAHSGLQGPGLWDLVCARSDAP